MERVIVTVEIPNTSNTYDLELPTDIPSVELAGMIAQALHVDTSSTLGYRLQADPPGRTLKEDETLGEAGVWDGSFITLMPNNL